MNIINYTSFLINESLDEEKEKARLLKRDKDRILYLFNMNISQGCTPAEEENAINIIKNLVNKNNIKVEEYLYNKDISRNMLEKVFNIRFKKKTEPPKPKTEPKEEKKDPNSRYWSNTWDDKNTTEDFVYVKNGYSTIKMRFIKLESLDGYVLVYDPENLYNELIKTDIHVFTSNHVPRIIYMKKFLKISHFLYTNVSFTEKKGYFYTNIGMVRGSFVLYREYSENKPTEIRNISTKYPILYIRAL